MSLYKERVEAKLEEWGAELDKLKAQAKGEAAESGIALDERFEEFKARVNSGWEELKGDYHKEKREAVTS